MQAIVTIAHETRISSYPAFVRLIDAIDHLDLATASRCFVSLATSNRFRQFTDHLRNTLTFEQKKEILENLLQQITLVFECLDPDMRQNALIVVKTLHNLLCFKELRTN